MYVTVRPQTRSITQNQLLSNDFSLILNTCNVLEKILICDVLGDLVSFVQIMKHEKHRCRSYTPTKISRLSLQLY